MHACMSPTPHATNPRHHNCSGAGSGSVLSEAERALVAGEEGADVVYLVEGEMDVSFFPYFYFILFFLGGGKWVGV